MVRNLLGSLLALAAAAAAAWSAFQPWYGARQGRTYRLGDLFGGLTASQSALWSGLFVPLLAAALIVLLAVLLRSRLLVVFSGLVVLGFTVLWLVQQSFESGPLTAAAGGLGRGVGLALGAGVLLLVAALLMRGRRPRGRRRRGRGGRLHEERGREDLPHDGREYGDREYDGREYDARGDEGRGDEGREPGGPEQHRHPPESRLHEDRLAALHADDDTEFPLPEDELSPPHRSYRADVPRGGGSPYGEDRPDDRGPYGR